MKAGLFLAVIIIVILEALRAFRDNRRVISDVKKLEERVKYLEDRLKER